MIATLTTAALALGWAATCAALPLPETHRAAGAVTGAALLVIIVASLPGVA
jgi:hypothetical protein